MYPILDLGEVHSLTGKNQLPAAFGQLKKLPGQSPQPGRVLEQRARHREVLLQIASGTATPLDATARKGGLRQELLARATAPRRWTAFRHPPMSP
ncbi:MAG: hypothetical protein RLZZ165_1659 [Bacteroidota bacterium]|jgi:hypothetical protein